MSHKVGRKSMVPQDIGRGTRDKCQCALNIVQGAGLGRTDAIAALVYAVGRSQARAIRLVQLGIGVVGAASIVPLPHPRAVLCLVGDAQVDLCAKRVRTTCAAHVLIVNFLWRLGSIEDVEAVAVGTIAAPSQSAKVGIAELRVVEFDLVKRVAWYAEEGVAFEEIIVIVYLA